MRIAYLIKCHTAPAQVNRLIQALGVSGPDDSVDFYVHVDKKSVVAPHIMRADNIFFMEGPDRVNVKWGQISSVEATLALLRTALRSGKGYDYFWHLSGQDYPIKSNAEIFAFFRKYHGKNFMKSFGPESPDYPLFLKRNETWYPQWMVHPQTAVRVLRRLYDLVTGGQRRTFRFFKRRRTPLAGLTALRGDGPAVYFFGERWFAITAACASFILDYLDKNPAYHAFFKGTFVPDECYFLTLVLNSPFRQEVWDYLCYMDWTEQKRTCKTLRVGDYKPIIRSRYFIARKFDEAVDFEILDMLDKFNRGE